MHDYARIEDYLGKHRGRRFWLLGNGPSLNDWSPTDVEPLGGLTIGINRSFQRFRSTTYHCFIAVSQLRHVVEGRVRAKTVFAPAAVMWRHKLLSKMNGVVSSRMCFVHQAGNRLNFRVGLHDRGYVGSFAGLFALQLAVHMGAGQIILLGFDARSSDGHFYAPNVHGGRDHMLEPLGKAATWLDGLGVEVLNASLDSAVPWWPKLTKTELVEHLSRQACQFR